MSRPKVQPPPSLDINTDLARSILVEFLRRETGRHGFRRGVIGVSGGVDSALACTLTAEALGPENVLAVRMPYKTSSPDSMDDALRVIEITGVNERTIDITGMVDPLFEQVPEADRIRRGNAMARARMIVLYDQSAAFQGLVIGTGNKTEILLGYTTQYGDAACALNPNGDLYKTQLRQLARAVGVPEAIVAKPPTADLWPGQTDEGELGYTYEEVDRLLFLLVDLRYSAEACVEAGFRRDLVEAVMERMRRNHFKRLMPPIAKLSGRTVGYDFLYLRDWGT
jgi:NAD+ synthase